MRRVRSVYCSAGAVSAVYTAVHAPCMSAGASLQCMRRVCSAGAVSAVEAAVYSLNVQHLVFITYCSYSAVTYSA